MSVGVTKEFLLPTNLVSTHLTSVNRMATVLLPVLGSTSLRQALTASGSCWTRVRMEGARARGNTSLKRTTNAAQWRWQTVEKFPSVTLAALHTLMIVA